MNSNNPAVGNYGLSCPSGGSYYICEDTSTRFIGCCDEDPCTSSLDGDCPDDKLHPGSFSATSYGDIPPQDCSSSSGSSEWYTCNTTMPPFIGCCETNACQNNGCSDANLVQARLSDNETDASAFLQPPTSSTTSSASSGSATLTSSPTSTSSSGATSSNDANARPSSSSSPSSSTGLIVGLSMVGVVILLAVLGGYLWWKRRERKKEERDSEQQRNEGAKTEPMMGRSAAVATAQGGGGEGYNKVGDNISPTPSSTVVSSSYMKQMSPPPPQWQQQQHLGGGGGGNGTDINRHLSQLSELSTEDWRDGGPNSTSTHLQTVSELPGSEVLPQTRGGRGGSVIE
ncbi:hypothetical protein F4778DRAFT_320274 [Xylariomycetidae sp. FL2044]|nr:hypothetical protein F4778DRAFT_320274 [Xylariomycetidae sp. FL2044]